MGSNGPSWADQWGHGGLGDDDEGADKSKGNKGGNTKKKMEEVKAMASAGFDKAKVIAVVGAHKVKTGTSTGFKWVKNQYQKKFSSK